MNSEHIWEDLSEQVSVDTLIYMYKNPSKWQIDLNSIIENLFIDHTFVKILEAGSSFGLTSIALSDKFEKTLLDIDLGALKKAEEVAALVNKNIIVLEKDIFKLSIEDEKYDIVFNSGVVEHFLKQDRIKMIKAMDNVLKPGGILLIALPNHLSFPYRFGYLYHRFRKTWVYPYEFKVKTLNKEAELNNLVFVKEYNVDDSTIFAFVPKRLTRIFKLSHKFFKFKGYLRICIYRKPVE